MRKVATLLALSLVASPLGMSSANAHHSSRYYYHDHVSTGEAILAAVLTAGIVVAAASMESQAYAGAPWGVIDTDVKPSDTQVYLDGGYVGVSGKFDGWPGYLPLQPGTYDLEFRRPGFEPFHLKARVLPGQRLVIKKKLHELPPGAPHQPEPVPPPRQAPQGSPRPQAPPQSAPDQGQDDGNWRWEEPKSHKAPSTSRGGKGGASPPPAPQTPPQDVPDDSDKAEPPVVSPNSQPEAEATPMTELKLEITPADASVYIDGEFYVNARDLEGGERGILLAPGEYKVDVVRPGYKTQNSTVVLGSQSRTLKIRLDKQ
jgi:hypothetical protein